MFANKVYFEKLLTLKNTFGTVEFASDLMSTTAPAGARRWAPLSLNYAAIIELRIKLRNFFGKLRESFRSFLIFVPNKYRDTLCKHFTTYQCLPHCVY